MQKKVVNFGADSYQIKYKTFLFWHSIKAVSGYAELFQNDPWDFTTGNDMVTKIFSTANQAVEFSKQFNTIEDIKEYHDGVKKRLKGFEKKRKQITKDKKVDIKL